MVYWPITEAIVPNHWYDADGEQVQEKKRNQYQDADERENISPAEKPPSQFITAILYLQVQSFSVPDV